MRSELLPIVGTPGMAGDLNLDGTGAGHIPINVADPVSDAELVNKKFLDDQVAITASTDVPIGTVLPYAGAAGSIPTNFLLCDGREVSRFTFAGLFNIIGIAYGSPTNGNVFKLPDMRGRAVMGLDNMGGQPKGLISALAGSTLGGKFGSEDHALAVAELPVHTHDYDDITYAGNAGVEEGDAGAQDTDNLFASTVRTSGGAGSTDPHNNTQPSMAQTYIIRA